jgi:hypothetical protein
MVKHLILRTHTVVLLTVVGLSATALAGQTGSGTTRAGSAATDPLSEGAALLGAPPQGSRVQVNIRPRRVRVGDRILLTLQLSYPTQAPPVVEELVDVPGLYVVDVQDRSSLALAAGRSVVSREVVWELEARDPGPLSLEALRIWFDSGYFDAPVPGVEVLDAPLRRMAAARPGRAPRRSRDEPPVLPEGRPPPTGGEDAAVIPGGRPLGDGVVATRPGGGATPLPGGVAGIFPGVVPGLFPGVIPGLTGGVLPGGALPGALPGGWAGGYPGGGVLLGPGGALGGARMILPPGGLTTGSLSPSDGFSAGVQGGWAESAHLDPWWEELVPQVQAWSSVSRDPTGWVELSTGVAPPRVYVGQQVTYLAAAGFTAEAGFRLQRDPEYFAPAPRDVWQVDVARYGVGFMGAARGELQDIRPFVQAFFPLRPGVLNIPPARMAYSLGGGGRFGPTDTLRADPVSVEVLPIPSERAPEGWDGAVGRYTAGVVLDQDLLAPGETAVLTVTVRGAGNIEGLTAPRPTNLRGVVLRPLGERAVVEVRDGVVGGVKVFQWLVTVAEPGLLSLGPFLLTYFDPWVGDFQIAATREVMLEGIGSP